MKKLVYLFLAVITVCTITSCGSTCGNTTDSESVVASDSTLTDSVEVVDSTVCDSVK